MGLWDNIKKIFMRKETKALPEAQSRPYNQGITLRREDGSFIMITPNLDRVGNQIYEQVFNHNTGERQCLPKFTIADNALAEAQTNRGATITSICMDVRPEWLNNEYYAHYIANYLLSILS